jgi:glycosyltransferase involved in cell wall biosynthesis
MIIESYGPIKQVIKNTDNRSAALLKHEIYSALKSLHGIVSLPKTIFKILHQRKIRQQLYPYLEAVHAGWDISVPYGSLNKFKTIPLLPDLKKQISSINSEAPQRKYSNPILQIISDRGHELLSLDKRLEHLSQSIKSFPSDKHVANIICYITHTSQLDTQNGYTKRSGEIVTALENNGIVVHQMCSHPYILKSRTAALGQRLLLEQIEAASKELAAAIPPKVSTIIAASDWTNGWVALLAAKKRGLRFAYEVRGQWQLTHEAIVPKYRETRAFVARNALERALARNADWVFSQTTALSKYLGVQSTSSIIPNGANITVSKRESAVINPKGLSLGYIGSLVPYEGLERAIKAVCALNAKYPQLSLTLIGGGSHKASLQKLVKNLRAKNYIHFTGTLSPEEAQLSYSKFDAIVLPRHNKKVCHIVESLKPMEALAHRKAVLITPLDVLKNIPGTLCANSFEVSAFSDLIEDCINNPEKLTKSGNEGYDWVQENRLWTDLIRPMAIWIKRP